MNRIIVDVFNSLVNVPLFSERFIRAVVIGVKYNLNSFMHLDGIGFFGQLVALLSAIVFLHKILILDCKLSFLVHYPCLKQKLL